MKKLGMIVIWTVVFGLNPKAQDSLVYTNLGGASMEEGVRVIEHTDSSFLVLLNSGEVENSTSSNFHLLTVSEMGEVLSSTSFGTYGSDRAYDMVRYGDTLIIAGITNGANLYDYDGFIFWIDMNSGDLYKEKYVDVGGEWSKVSALALFGDTVFAVIEAVQNQSTPRFMMMDMQGNELSSAVIEVFDGYTVHSASSSVHEGGVLICASTLTAPHDAMIASLNSELELNWNTTFSMSDDDELFDLVELSDSSIAAIGYSSSFNEEDEDIMVVKLTQSGDWVDTLILGYDITVDNKNDRGLGIDQRGDTIYLTGFTNTFSEGGEECFITRIRANFTLLPNSTTFGTPQSERSSSVIPYGSGAVGLGTTSHKAAGGQDALFWYRPTFSFLNVLLIKQKSPYTPDNIVLEIEEVRSDRPETLIDLMNQSTHSNEMFELYSLTGRLMSKGIIPEFERAQSGLSTGVYVIRIGEGLSARQLKIFIP